MGDAPCTIRPARKSEYQAIGEMTVRIYEKLPGMPGRDEQPEYYAMLADTKGRADLAGIEILAAVSPDNELLGAVTFVGDMASYKSGGTASLCTDACGIRLLAVSPNARNRGAGRALTLACIRRAGELGAARVILHTTKAMAAAWRLYETMGFVRCPDLDFNQGTLPVYGFCLASPGSLNRFSGEQR